jgi:3-hydroxyacyl-[acyl-carrier-protein] dehydratase
MGILNAQSVSASGSVMPPALLFDLTQIDLTAKPIFDKEAIGRVNPQRFEMQQLDGVLWCDKERMLVLGYKDVTEGEFWVRGHIPDRPLMPGVIMVESAAQLLSFFVNEVLGEHTFIGFASIDSAKFRATVQPGQRLLLLGKITKFRPGRKYDAYIQGLVNNTMVFETEVSGMAV